jgi:cell division protease FtsH
VFQNITTGAESDIEQVTGSARAMVGRWGMAPEVGFVAVVPQDNNPFLGSEVSDELKRTVDVAVKRLVDEAHERVTRLLGDRREQLDSLAETLLDRETVDQDEAYAAAGLTVPPSTAPQPTPAEA